MRLKDFLDSIAYHLYLRPSFGENKLYRQLIHFANMAIGDLSQISAISTSSEAVPLIALDEDEDYDRLGLPIYKGLNCFEYIATDYSQIRKIISNDGITLYNVAPSLDIKSDEYFTINNFIFTNNNINRLFVFFLTPIKYMTEYLDDDDFERYLESRLYLSEIGHNLVHAIKQGAIFYGMLNTFGNTERISILERRWEMFKKSLNEINSYPTLI